MKTENYKNETTSNSDVPEFNLLAGSTGTRVSLSLQRFSTACLTKWHALKERVTEQLVAEYGNSVSTTLLQQAVQEADAIAATTLFPSLFLPALAEEKVQLAYAWSNRQREIHEQPMAFAE